MKIIHLKEKRRDSKGRILHTGESQRTDGKYLYKYVDATGKVLDTAIIYITPPKKDTERAKRILTGFIKKCCKTAA